MFSIVYMYRIVVYVYMYRNVVYVYMYRIVVYVYMYRIAVYAKIKHKENCKCAFLFAAKVLHTIS